LDCPLRPSRLCGKSSIRNPQSEINLELRNSGKGFNQQVDAAGNSTQIAADGL
jgi:hypothetical protein